MLEFADSFNKYGTDPEFLLNGVYAEYANVLLVDDPDGISSQRVMSLEPNENCTLRYVLSTAMPVVGVSLRAWAQYLPSNADQLVYLHIWRDAGNSPMVYMVLDTTGRISVWKEQSAVATLLGTTTSPVISAEGWWHIEARLTCSSSNVATDGEFELRVEGATVLDISGFSTSFPDAYQLTFDSNDDGLGAGPGMYFKDYVVWNNDGDDNNDFLGAVRVINCVPNADVDLGSWTPNTGTEGWPILDNNPPVDAQFLSADDTATDPMEYEMTNLPDDITAVKGVFTFVRARKTDGGDGKMQVGIISGAATDQGVDRPITAGFIYWKDVSERDPNIDAPWTKTTVDASKITIDRTL